MEQSTLAMHASMLAAQPSLRYFSDASLRVIDRVTALRVDCRVYFTMDAGPHVKVLVLAADAERVRHELEAVSGVARVIACAPGPAAALCEPPAPPRGTPPSAEG
jgi:diphosphomevalonate decarboxylase